MYVFANRTRRCYNPFEHTFLAAYIINCVEQKKTLTDVLYFLIPVAVAVFIKLMFGTVFGSLHSACGTGKNSNGNAYAAL